MAKKSPQPFTHGPALHVGQAVGIADQSIGDIVPHFVEGNQRFKVARSAGLRRRRPQEFVHLHTRAGAIGGGGHVRVVSAAEVVSFSKNRIAADPSQPKVILLTVP